MGSAALLTVQVWQPGDGHSDAERLLNASVVAQAAVVGMAAGQCAEYYFHSSGRDWTGRPTSDLRYGLEYRWRPGLVLELDRALEVPAHRGRLASRLCVPLDRDSTADRVRDGLQQLARGSRLHVRSDALMGVSWRLGSWFAWAYLPDGRSVDRKEDLYQPILPPICFDGRCTATRVSQALRMSIGEGELFAGADMVGIAQPTDRPGWPQLSTLSDVVAGEDLRLIYELALRDEPGCAADLPQVAGVTSLDRRPATVGDRLPAAIVRAHRPALEALLERLGPCVASAPISYGSVVQGFDANRRFRTCEPLSFGDTVCPMVLLGHEAACRSRLGHESPQTQDFGRCSDCSFLCPVPL